VYATPRFTDSDRDTNNDIAEEIRDASIVLPRVTMWAIVVNGFFGFVMMITFCFTVGDPFAAIGSLTGYPFIQVFYTGTGSLAGASIMVAIMVVTITSSVISTLATVSRQSWSFARDGGLPFAGFIGHVKPGWNIPLNAVMLTWLITCLLSLINIGSTVAFNAISSSATVALLSTYIISISCLVLKRIRGQRLPPHRWTLGRFGLFINLGALAYLFTIWVFLFFPIAIPVDAATMNWNSLIYGGTLLFAVIYYFVIGRKYYVPPVALVSREHAT
jgi:choline transport protein